MPSTRLAQEPQVHEHRTAKVVELVSSSSRGFQEAIENGLADARATTRGITGAHVEAMSVLCKDGQITAYKVNLKLSFGVERPSDREDREAHGPRRSSRGGSSRRSA